MNKKCVCVQIYFHWCWCIFFHWYCLLIPCIRYGLAMGSGCFSWSSSGCPPSQLYCSVEWRHWHQAVEEELCWEHPVFLLWPLWALQSGMYVFYHIILIIVLRDVQIRLLKVIFKMRTNLLNLVFFFDLFKVIHTAGTLCLKSINLTKELLC